MNLCTDQLAMMLAAPGQLVSVSDVASDPQVSAMVDEARAYPQNFGRAEEIYLMKPDLVLVGEYSRTQAAEMLERLGVEVLRLPFARSMEDVSKGMLILGRALGREAEAEAMVADFETRLARQRAEVRSNPRAALYSANGYTTGRLSLALVGVEDLVVVTTPDAVLVTRRSAAQDVKRVVDALTESGRPDLV